MVLEHAPEQPLAVLERDIEERAAVQVEEVEGLVHEPGRLLVAKLGLEQAEIRASVVVEGDDLTVDDGLVGLDPARRRRQQPREVGLGVVEVPRPESGPCCHRRRPGRGTRPT